MRTSVTLATAKAGNSPRERKHKTLIIPLLKKNFSPLITLLNISFEKVVKLDNFDLTLLEILCMCIKYIQFLSKTYKVLLFNFKRNVFMLILRHFFSGEYHNFKLYYKTLRIFNSKFS